MALKFRRGTTAQQSGSLAFGEPYVNTTLGTLVVGGQTGDIVLSTSGTGSTGNFGAISGSGLDITGNANIAGNVTVGGQLTIGDQTSDTVNVVASLSSSLIPQTTNAFDLGSLTKIWRDLYISTGSIKFVDGSGTQVGTLTATSLNAGTQSVNELNAWSASAKIELSNLELTTASLNTSVSNLNSFSSSQLGKDATLATLTASYDGRFTTLGTYTGSVEGRFSTLATLTGSNATRLSNLETTSASVNTSITNLNSATASLIVETTNLELFTASLSTTSNVRFGSLGIGMAASGTSGRIDASGDIVAYSTSDKNFKENITPIPNAIDKIRKISGNTYDWKAELKDVHGFEGNDVGVIAQEIEEVLPQLVTTRETGYKAVKYDKLVALLIEGIKEQQQHIDNLTIQVEELKKAKGL